MITDNIVANNYNGIALIDSPARNACPNRGNDEGAYGPCRTQNITVENNEVTMTEGATGVVQDGASSAVFTTQNLRWRNNTYHVSNAIHPNDGHADGSFAWNNDWRNWAASKAFGNDTGGSFSLSPRTRCITGVLGLPAPRNHRALTALKTKPALRGVCLEHIRRT